MDPIPTTHIHKNTREAHMFGCSPKDKLAALYHEYEQNVIDVEKGAMENRVYPLDATNTKLKLQEAFKKNLADLLKATPMFTTFATQADNTRFESVLRAYNS